jgi:hypothetical protein
MRSGIPASGTGVEAIWREDAAATMAPSPVAEIPKRIIHPSIDSLCIVECGKLVA